MLKLFGSVIFTILFSAISTSSYALPPNAHVTNNGWACNTGFKRQGQQCNKIFVPPNGVLSGQGWVCRTGYELVGQQCNASKQVVKKAPSFDDLLNQIKSGKAEKEQKVKTAVALYQKKNYKAALNMFRPLAKQGHPRAKFYLGVMYSEGRGVLKDERKAAEWTFAAAKQGYSHAQYNLGIIYRTGRGVTKDSKKSYYWYNKAAKQGHVPATHYVGLAHYVGKGVLKDEERGLEAMRFSAGKNYAESQFILGISYCAGRSVIKSKRQCAAWIKRAFDNGHPEAAAFWEKNQLWKHK